MFKVNNGGRTENLQTGSLTNSSEAVALLQESPDGLIQVMVVILVRATCIRAQVEKQEETVQPLFALDLQDAGIDVGTAAITLSHVGRSIVGITQGAGGEIYQLYAQLTSPSRDMGIVILVRRDEKRCISRGNTGLLHDSIASQHVLVKLPTGDQQ